MTDTVFLIAALILAHLVADFVLQTGGLALAKSDRGSRAAYGLLIHGVVVAICLVPVGLAFGGRGWAYVAISAISHVLIDRSKIVLTRRAAAAALRDANERHEPPVPAPADHLGRAWTPAPAALFLADQAGHLLVAGVAWAVLLAGQAPGAAWTTTIDTLLGGWDRPTVHHVVGISVVVLSLLIVNIRAASLFVGVLVRPVEGGQDGAYRWGGRAAPAVAPGAPPSAVGSAAPETSAPSWTPRRWSIRVGPLEARVAAEADPEPSPPASAVVAAAGPVALTARVGATIGVLERLLIVVFVLAGTDVAIGLVVAAKTLARFRQLDDREFAEYYLLGTLASVAVAIVTGLAGKAALSVLLA